ncbi:MAG: hypothetical protein QXU82_00255 [Candidatus Aenigmatarchaeota archaeon]
MKRITVFLIVLAMSGGAYAACDCPKPSDWSSCSAGQQERFVYYCNESTGGNCFGEKEVRECAPFLSLALWLTFFAVVIGLFAAVFLLAKPKKKA